MGQESNKKMLQSLLQKSGPAVTRKKEKTGSLIPDNKKLSTMAEKVPERKDRIHKNAGTGSFFVAGSPSPARIAGAV